MSRPANPKSVRQKAFKRLSKLTGTKREHAIEKLKAEFGIGYSYAATLYASYRTLRKDEGSMPQVFSVRDSKDGKKCNPYIRIQNVLKPKKADSLTPGDAKLVYIAALKKKLEQVNHL